MGGTASLLGQCVLMAAVAICWSYTIFAAALQDSIISTVATGGTPMGVAVDVSSDLVYITAAGNNDIRRVNLTSKQITTLSLTLAPTQLIGAHVDVSGSVYYADSSRHVVYRYSWANNVRSSLPNALAVVAGKDTFSGFTGDGESTTRRSSIYPKHYSKICTLSRPLL